MSDLFKGSSMFGSTQIDRQLAQQSREALTGAQGLYRQTTPPPSTYVGISPQRQAGLNQVYQMAQRGSPVARNTLGEYNKTMQGGYLSPDSNPWFGQNVQRAIGSATRPVLSNFAGTGRLASGAAMGTAGDIASQIASQMWGQNYQNERGLMGQYMSQAPQMANLELTDPMRMASVGSQYEADTAAQQAEAVRQFMWPREKQQEYEASLAASPLNQQVSSQQGTPFDWLGFTSGMLRGMSPMGMLGGGGGGGATGAGQSFGGGLSQFMGGF